MRGWHRSDSSWGLREQGGVRARRTEYAYLSRDTTRTLLSEQSRHPVGGPLWEQLHQKG